ncbi:hypothetical protein MUP05_07770 [Candidatus Bathyarchaeota archaeon]|nr:hypothetical protein [Candidatus Bathyarchaeota archaeon]
MAVLGKDTTGDTSYPEVTVGSTNTETTADVGGTLMGNTYAFTRMTIKKLGCYSSGNSHAKLGLYNSDLSQIVITEAEIATVASQWNYRTLATRYYANANFYIMGNGEGSGALRYTGGAFGLKYKIFPYANAWTTGGFGDSGERLGVQAVCYRGKGFVLGTRFQAPASGNPIKAYVYFDVGSSGNFRVAVHADAGNHPTTKISESASQAIVAGAWNEITIPSTGIVGGTWYWPLFQFDNLAALPHRATGVAGNYSFYYGLDYGAFPADLTGLGTVESGTSANMWSIYINLAQTYYKSLPATEVSVAIYVRKIGKTLSPTEISVATLARVASRFKSLIATETAVSSLARVATFAKLLSVTELSIATFIKTVSKTLTAVEVSVANLGKSLTHLMSLAATAISATMLSKLATFYRNLSTTEVSAPSLSKIATFFKSLPAVETSIAALSKLATYVRNLSLAMTAISNLFRVSTFLKTLSVAESSVAILAKKMFQSLSVTAISAATLSIAKVFTRALSAVSTAVVELQKSITRIVSLAVTETVSLTMSRVTTFSRTLAAIETSVVSLFKGFFRSLAITEVSTTSLSKIASRFVTFAATAGSIASLTTSKIIVKILSALAGSTASITKAKKFLKVLSVKATGILTLLAKWWGISPLRIYRVPSESRLLTVPEEKRILGIPQENRVVKA